MVLIKGFLVVLMFSLAGYGMIFSEYEEDGVATDLNFSTGKIINVFNEEVKVEVDSGVCIGTREFKLDDQVATFNLREDQRIIFIPDEDCKKILDIITEEVEGDED